MKTPNTYEGTDVKKRYGMTCNEIAKIMGITPKEVHTIKSEAMRKMRRKKHLLKEFAQLIY